MTPATPAPSAPPVAPDAAPDAGDASDGLAPPPHAPTLRACAAGPLGALVAVDVTGADAESFLQGQLSNDVVAPGPDAALLAGWCSPKGRLLASPIVHRLPDGFRLAVAADLVEALVRRLRMFVLRAAVTVAHRDDLAAHALFAPVRARGADAAVREWLGATVADGASAASVAAAPLRAATGADGASVLRWHDLPGAASGAAAGSGPASRFLAFVPRTAGGPTADGVAALEAAAADALWRLGDLRAGLPSIRAATADAFVPQTVNFGEAGGLSFKKGCYPGQEIVARMQYLGKLKRHARAFRAAPVDPDAPAPGPGAKLDVRAAGAHAPAVGDAQVVDAVATDGALELLAVVRVDAEAPELALERSAAREFDLPYAPPGAGEARGRAAAAKANAAPQTSGEASGGAS